MPGNPLTDPNWADDTTDTVIRLVGTVRDKATTPIVYAALGVVYGLIAAFLGLFALVLVLIGATRGLQAALDWQFDHDRSVYISYLVVGGILSGAALFLFKKRNANVNLRVAAENSRPPHNSDQVEVPMSDVHDVIIIGSGPAGLTAAIYVSRASLEPLLIEGEPSSTSDQPGGQLMLTTDVENFPGFPDGIMGPDLMMNMRAQAERFGTKIITDKVTDVDLTERPFKISVRDTEYLANAIIVSTGAQSLMLGLEAEERLIGHGLSTCATCDGFFFRGHDIAVVGGGDSALEEASFLTKFADKVTVIHRRDELRASKIMQERAFANPKIEFLWDTTVVDILGEDKVTGMQVRNLKTGEESHLDVTGVFVAIGHRPNTDLFRGKLDMEDNGYLVTTGKSSYTNVEGVFACGDVQDHVYRQAITAAGSGCTAAIDAERWLEAQHG